MGVSCYLALIAATWAEGGFVISVSYPGIYGQVARRQTKDQILNRTEHQYTFLTDPATDKMYLVMISVVMMVIIIMGIMVLIIIILNRKR